MIIISWKDIDDTAKELARQTLDKNFDCIIGVGNSGLTHAVIVAKILKIPMYPFGVSSYNGRQINAPVISYKPMIDIRGKKVLVVDDIIATGNTFVVLKEILYREYGVESVATAAGFLSLLVCKDYPDFYARSYTRQPDEWILFPWDDPSDFQ